MLELSVETEIEASPDVIWAALVDLPRYGAWNPFIRRARGTVAVGETVSVRVRTSLPLPVPLFFEARVLVCEPGRELRWRGQVLASFLAGGEHVFRLEPLGPGRTRFVQEEIFTGLVPPLLSRLVVGEARKGFTAMNRALKALVEQERAAAPARRAG
jgi:hypothetical protein